MTRQTRCEFQGAIYLLTLTGHPHEHVFYDPDIFRTHPENPRRHAPDATYFEGLLWDTCEQYNAPVHAYVLEPSAAMIVIQTLGAPLAWIAHDVLARYATYLIQQKRIHAGERPFPRRYRAQIVQPAKLPYAVRYVQRRHPVHDSRRRAINHPFNSSLFYAARRALPDQFVINTTRDALRALGYPGANAYFEFMSARDTPLIAQMLAQHIIGEENYIERVRGTHRGAPRALSPDDILREVTGAILHSGPSVACSSTHRGALARALVAWYAMRTGVARIGTVAEWFGVTSSDLRQLISRHRRINPLLFSKSLPDLFPALPTRRPPSRPRPIPPHLTDSQLYTFRMS